MRSLRPWYLLALLPGPGYLPLVNAGGSNRDPTAALTTAADSSQDARRVRERRAASNQAIARHDTAGLAAILAPNVVVVTSNSMHIVGRDANALRFDDQFRGRPDVTYRRTPEAVQVFAAWRMAEERGRWVGSWTDTDGPIRVGGSYAAKWRQLNGEWFVESETYFPDHCQGGAYCRQVPQ